MTALGSQVGDASTLAPAIQTIGNAVTGNPSLYGSSAPVYAAAPTVVVGTSLGCIFVILVIFVEIFVLPLLVVDV